MREKIKIFAKFSIDHEIFVVNIQNTQVQHWNEMESGNKMEDNMW